MIASGVLLLALTGYFWIVACEWSPAVRSQSQYRVLFGQCHLGGALVAACQLGQSFIGAVRAVMEQNHRAGSGATAQLDGIVTDRVSEASFVGELLGREQLRVVGERVGACRELQRGLVILAAAIGSCPERGGTVVGHVGKGRMTVAHSVAERAPALVGDLAREDLKALTLPCASGGVRERPYSSQLASGHRKMWWRHRPREHCLGRGAVLLRGQHQPYPRVLVVAG